MLKSSEIRQQFLDFFCQKHGHTFVPSSPVVPHDDPTLLFTNAGMNQFKPLFLGQEKRGYTRAANTQKCIRAGGKHNDLDDVGRSRRHHTFFEMLGNWSFGDYFKADAIKWAWELLTKVWKLDPTRLHVSCFQGDEKNGVPRDTEAADLWKKIAKLPDEHIHYFGKDNFWEMGDTGPCGPCTEIYIDRTPDKSGRDQVNGEDPRVMEIWNLVFIQFNRTWKAGGAEAVRAFDAVRAEPLPGEDSDKARDRVRLATFGTSVRSDWVAQNTDLNVLPAKHVDTGMGFERVSQVLQDVGDNFAIDLWNPFFAKLSSLSGRSYAGLFPKSNAPDPAAEAASPQLRSDIAFRVIADHIRCLTFALTDGAVPSNEGRGYVLRRILRRAVRFGRQQLELKQPFLHEMVDVVVESMGGAFPELKKNPKHVAELIKDEEVSFGRTLDRGISLYREAETDAVRDALRQVPSVEISITDSKYLMDDGSSLHPGGAQFNVRSRESGSKLANFVLGEDSRACLDALKELKSPIPKIAAADAFKLHDTFGFPIDLTQQMALERGMTVDIAGYEKLMEEAREKARAGAKGGDSPVYTLPPAIIAELQKQNVSPTDDSFKFQGADETVTAKVKAIWNGSNLNLSADTSEDQEVAVILDRTNFYAEMGGQVGDAGQLASTSSNFDVETTRIVGGYVLHVGRVGIGKLNVGDPVTCVLASSRNQTQKNHTATHLANWALREILGDGVQQKGSLVDPEKLRFDFTHNSSLKDDEIAKVEQLVNESIAKKLQVSAQEAPQQDALKINGLRAVFGEKYPPMVRVVSIGAKVDDLLKNPTNESWRKFSIEFCGGTHLTNTAEVGSFVITSEESVSKGVRRIVALTGARAQEALDAGTSVAREMARVQQLTDDQIDDTETLLEKLLLLEIPLHARKQTIKSLDAHQQRVKKWEKLQKARSAAALDVAGIATDLLDKATDIAGGKLIVVEIAGANADQLRAVLDSIRKRQPSVAALVVANDGTKLSFVTAVTDDFVAKGLKAGDWVKEAAKVTGGGGGGSPQMGQAGGKDPSKLGEALAIAMSFATEKLRG